MKISRHADLKNLRRNLLYSDIHLCDSVKGLEDDAVRAFTDHLLYSVVCAAAAIEVGLSVLLDFDDLLGIS